MSQATRVPRRLSQFVPWIISRVDLWNGGQSGPIEDAQKLKDAQAAKGAEKAG